MEIENNKSLLAFNTFGIDCIAEYFVSVKTVEDLKEALSQNIHDSIFILGGGSNMLLTQSIEALVLHIDLRGISIKEQDDDYIFLEIMAGENWHDFVSHCVEQGYGGIENLSLIPGNVGTAPIQNIGAYGVELADVFVSCSAVEISTQKEKLFTKDQCKFGYRNSIFKNEEKGRYIISSVTLRLTKKNHRINTSYGAIKDVLREKGIDRPSIKEISEVVIGIRESKLPDPSQLGNSGSFFKNPIIDGESFKVFRTKFPDAPFYEISPTQYKIPAGWLIETAGFKGLRIGDAGVYKNQALVLVNHGSASGKDIWELAMAIQQKVKEQFNIFIEPEVNVI